MQSPHVVDLTAPTSVATTTAKQFRPDALAISTMMSSTPISAVAPSLKVSNLQIDSGFCRAPPDPLLGLAEAIVAHTRPTNSPSMGGQSVLSTPLHPQKPQSNVEVPLHPWKYPLGQGGGTTAADVPVSPAFGSSQVATFSNSSNGRLTGMGFTSSYHPHHRHGEMHNTTQTCLSQIPPLPRRPVGLRSLLPFPIQWSTLIAAYLLLRRLLGRHTVLREERCHQCPLLLQHPLVAQLFLLSPFIIARRQDVHPTSWALCPNKYSCHLSSAVHLECLPDPQPQACPSILNALMEIYMVALPHFRFAI